MFDILKKNVIKELIELSEQGMDTMSAMGKVSMGLFDEDLQDWSEGYVSTKEATDIILVMDKHFCKVAKITERLA
tara:strand:+ start:314 stop:538 length:225 start_codon:yes stop_codon:yes gene_type:complete